MRGWRLRALPFSVSEPDLSLSVPIHSFGYGRSHDPASLWLISNHASGTYTFVKDWYDLRNCLAGCLGGLMSIGLVNMKLNMKIVDAHRFQLHKCSGGPSAIVGSLGRKRTCTSATASARRCSSSSSWTTTTTLCGWPMMGQVTTGATAADLRALDATDQFVVSMALDALPATG